MAAPPPPPSRVVSAPAVSSTGRVGVGSSAGSLFDNNPSRGQTSKFIRGKEPVPSLLNHYRGHKGCILSLCFHPNLQTVYSSGADGYVMVWNYRKEARALRFEGHTGPVNEVSLSKYGDMMITASDDCTVRVWVPVINGEYISLRGHQRPVKSACFSPIDNSKFATGSADKTVKLWSVQAAKMKSGCTKFKSHEFLQSFCGHRNWVNSVRFSPDGRLICSASDDKTIQVWDVRNRSKQPVSSMTVLSKLGCPLKAEFNPCGSSYIGVSTSQNSFLMYDVREGKLIQSYTDLFGEDGGAVNSFAFHNSGDFAVCVSQSAQIKILDLIEGRPVFTLRGPQKKLCAVAFNPDGSLFATGGDDQEVLIWEPVLIPYDEAEADDDANKENVEESRVPSDSDVSASKTEGTTKGGGEEGGEEAEDPSTLPSNAKRASAPVLFQ